MHCSYAGHRVTAEWQCHNDGHVVSMVQTQILWLYRKTQPQTNAHEREEALLRRRGRHVGLCFAMLRNAKGYETAMDFSGLSEEHLALSASALTTNDFYLNRKESSKRRMTSFACVCFYLITDEVFLEIILRRISRKSSFALMSSLHIPMSCSLYPEVRLGPISYNTIMSYSTSFVSSPSFFFLCFLLLLLLLVFFYIVFN